MARIPEQNELNYEYFLRQRNNKIPVFLANGTAVESVDQLNQLPAIKVRETEMRNPEFIVPYKIYSATDLQNGKYLLRDETREPSLYDAKRFEVLSAERVRQLKKTARYQTHRCPACGEFDFSMQESYEICRKCGWVDAKDSHHYNLFSAEEHGRLYREGRIYFQEWTEGMSEGQYFLRRNLIDGYLVAVDVKEYDMSAFAIDYWNQGVVADGSAWAEIERFHGNLAVSKYFVQDYLERAAKNNMILNIPVVSKEKRCIRATSKGGDPINVEFGEFIAFDETEMLARVYSSEAFLPLNISLDDRSDQDLSTGDICKAKLWSDDYEVTIFPNEEEYRKANSDMDPISLIPRGTFPADPEQKNFRQNALILFSGIVKDVERNPRPKLGDPVQRLLIETYTLNFNLFYFEDEFIEPGSIVHGQVWLYGELKKGSK